MSPLTVMLLGRTQELLQGVGMNPAMPFVAIQAHAANVMERGDRVVLPWVTFTVAQFRRLASPSVPVLQPLP
jgi:hypothetical protein